MLTFFVRCDKMRSKNDGEEEIPLRERMGDAKVCDGMDGDSRLKRKLFPKKYLHRLC